MVRKRSKCDSNIRMNQIIILKNGPYESWIDEIEKYLKQNSFAVVHITKGREQTENK